MLNHYNHKIAAIGNALRTQLLFDIFESISHYNFFKIRFFKTIDTNDLVLKHTKKKANVFR